MVNEMVSARVWRLKKRGGKLREVLLIAVGLGLRKLRNTDVFFTLLFTTK